VLPRLRRGLKATERPSALHYRKGVELARAGRVQQALGEWRLAIALDPAGPRPYEATAGYWEAVGQPEQAVQVWERLALANPTAPHRDCRLAQAAFAAGWITRAGEAADRAVHEEPACPLAHTIRGIALEDAGESAEAVAELARARQLSPDDPRVTLTLAQVEGRSGHLAEAARRVREVLAREPGSLQAHYLMGWLLARTRPPSPATDAEAERHLRQVLAQEPRHPAASAELGALYARQGQPARARPLLEAARAQAPADPTVTRHLAEVYALRRDPRAAALATAAGRLEEYQARRRDLRRRHLHRPTDPTVTLQLARLELAAGQTAEANDLTRQVLRADPDNPAALELMHSLIAGPSAPPAASP
jgi:Flp pilus assembly protein TadD